VQGNRLVSAIGQTVTLRGVNRMGTEYACVQGWGMSDGPRDAVSIRAMKAWAVNAVRLSLNEDCWLGINGVPPEYAGANYQRMIKDYVSVINLQGLYAILELHWNAPGTTLSTDQQPMPDLDHTPTFWSQVASAFKGNDAVILDLFNEPWPDDQRDSPAAWTCWRDGGTCPGVPFQTAGMQTLVDAVRATGATNVITLAGVSHSNALSGWLANKPADPLNNLAASWHVYNFNTCNTIGCFESTVAPVAAQVPVIASEIGMNTCDATFLNALMGWLDAHQMSYLAWTWNIWGPDCSSFGLIADYSGTPTPYGQIYKDHLAQLP
jgi:endoglucanase